MATKGKINVDFTMRYIGALRANRIVANPNRYSTINYKDIVTYAARAAHVPESSIEVAMDALYDAAGDISIPPEAEQYLSDAGISADEPESLLTLSPAGML